MPHYNYCVNVLILGCSFSYGSYYMDDSIANARDAEQCTADVCWYDWLDPQHHYTVYTIPGGGWLNYMTILSEINLKQFDQCIIQETFETRMSLFHQQEWNQVNRKNYVSGEHNIEMNYGDFRLCDKVDGKSAWMHEHIVQACVTHGNHLLQQARVPSYRFSFQGGEWSHSWILPLDIPPVADTLFFEEGLHNWSDQPGIYYEEFETPNWEGHLTLKGNKKLGKMIRNAL